MFRGGCGGVAHVPVFCAFWMLPFSTSVSTFDSTLSSASVPTPLINAFSNGNTAFEYLRTSVGQAISDVKQLGNGYCQGAPQKQCNGGVTDPADCVACIGFGVRRCAALGTTSC